MIFNIIGIERKIRKGLTFKQTETRAQRLKPPVSKSQNVTGKLLPISLKLLITAI